MIRHLSLFALVFTFGCSQADSQQHGGLLASLLPESGSIQRWSMPDTARIYRGTDLYRFIDGGADLFFEYGFGQALAADYQNTRGESINLEIYEMSDAGAAYGIYSVRSGEEAAPIDIGQGGSVHSYYIMFWKDRYFVSVAGSDSTAECRRGLEAIARAVDRKALTRGKKPDVLALLSPEKLLERRYVRGYLGLSTIHLFEADGMFPMHEGVVGTYRDHSIIIMRYANATEAHRRLETIGRDLKSNTRFRDYSNRDHMSTVRDGENQILCFARSGEYLVVAISSNEATAKISCKKTASTLGGR